MNKYYCDDQGFCNKYMVLVASSAKAVKYCESNGYERISYKEAVRLAFILPAEIEANGSEAFCGLETGLWNEPKEWKETTNDYRRRAFAAAAKHLG